MKKRIVASLMIVAVLIITVFTSGGAQRLEAQTNGTTSTAQVQKPKYVFYFIGDGLGASQRQFTEYFFQDGDTSKKLLMDTFPVAGINTTYSSDTLVTDSAAAGTALATGHKTNNGIISQKPDGTNVKTLIELAEEQGMGTGIVTTTRLTHATPAVFASHNASRDNENAIAADFVDSGVDYFAGGGARHFIGENHEGVTDAVGKTISSKREDRRDLIDEFANRKYKTFLGLSGAEQFMSYKPAKNSKIFAAFTTSHIPYEIDRINDLKDYPLPSLADMTQKGIELLSTYDKGFFMMVEGGRIDHACHANDAPGAIYDTLALDDAIATAYEFYNQYPEQTLIVVAGDHETGGMGLGFGTDYFLKMDTLKSVKVSVEDILQGVYAGDHDAFFTYIAEKFGLKDLTDKEKAEITTAMNAVDTGQVTGSIYGGYDPVAIAATHVLSERANIQWTTYAHTGTAIPLSAVGNGADHFGGYKDNTEIAKSMADVLGFQLSE